MRFLSVADRELRAAARRSVTYYVRWLTGIAFFGLLVWLLWAFDALTNQRNVPEVLQVFSILIFLYCLIIGTARTADCLSSEKREGTLGLLFLTNLNSAEIVAGKLCSNALATVYGLVAIFPIMALPLLMGGITGEHFWCTVLALVNAILFSLAVGFAASAVCLRQFPAVATATGIALFFGLGTLGLAGIINSYRGAKWIVDLLAISSPFYPLLIADGSKMFGANHYWLALGTVTGLSLASLVLVSGQLARSWRDRPKVARSWNPFRRNKNPGPPRSRSNPALRRRLLDINPFLWLAGRRQISSPVFMVLTLIIVAFTSYVTAPYFGRVMGGGTSRAMIGSVFAWVWSGLALLALSLYYAATVASQRLAEDKQAGALEMILCTPTSERIISRGLWLAYVRRMLFPVLVCVLVHAFFVWQVMILCVIDPPERIPRGVTPGELFWGALFNAPIRGFNLDWQFRFMLQILLLLLVLMFVVWITCGWVGRWLGLKMKHPGFAPILTLALIVVPPILGFSFLCYLADKFNVDRLPERQFLPMMMWVAFGVGILHCLLLSWWAAGRLRAEFRNVVTSRFQPSVPRRWWWLTWRGLFRLALRTAVVGVGMVLIGLSFYGYQNWSSRRNWNAFVAERNQQGETLDFTKYLPASASDEMNFGRSAAFQQLLASRQQGLGKILLDQNNLDNAFQRYVATPETIEWSHQQELPLIQHLAALGSLGRSSVGRTNNAAVAPAMLQLLQRHEALLAELASAARLPQLQFSEERSARTVIDTAAVEAKMLERLQFTFALRACARLHVGTNAAAGADLLTSLNLARLARQLPDAKSSMRVQVMLGRACQPLWEGCIKHAWTEPQLLAFQRDLVGFDLFADHTNTIRRVTLAYLASWQAIVTNAAAPLSIPDANGGFVSNASWRWQPRAWWYDRGIQLYRAGQHSSERLDVATERVRWDHDWSALNGLTVGDDVEQLIEPYPYMNNVPNPTALAVAKTFLNQALLAIALERYRLAHGCYPESAGKLMPDYVDRMPHDVMTGRDMIYQPIAADRFILRSVGPDGDDGRKNRSSDDWLWAWPTNAVPAVVSPK